MPEKSGISDFEQMKQRMGKEENRLTHAIKNVGPLDRFTEIPNSIKSITKEVNELRQLGSGVVYEIARRLKFAKDQKLHQNLNITWEEWAEKDCGLKPQSAYKYVLMLEKLGDKPVEVLGSKAAELLPAHKVLEKEQFNSFLEKALEYKPTKSDLRKMVNEQIESFNNQEQKKEPKSKSIFPLSENGKNIQLEKSIRNILNTTDFGTKGSLEALTLSLEYILDTWEQQVESVSGMDKNEITHRLKSILETYIEKRFS